MIANGEEERKIRGLLEEAHRRIDPSSPPFESLWEAAASARPGIARYARAALAAAAVVVLVVAAATLVLAPRRNRGPGPSGPADVLRFAESISGWQAPLDFLLRTPGREVFESAPVFSAPAPALSPTIPSDTGKEI